MSRVSRVERLEDARNVVTGGTPRLPAPPLTRQEIDEGLTGHEAVLVRYVTNVTAQVRLRRETGQDPTPQQEVALDRVRDALVALARGPQAKPSEAEE